MKLKITLTPGDFNGIGPEIILKALAKLHEPNVEFLIVSHQTAFEHLFNRVGRSTLQKFVESESDQVSLVCPDYIQALPYEPRPGEIRADAGKIAMECIRTATQMCLNGEADAIVTAPISKEAIAKAGYKYPGHTEYLADLCSTTSYTMMLVSSQLRVGLVTTHIPLSEVNRSVTQEAILAKLRIMHIALKQNYGIDQPKIDVFGLNPHAGDGGVMGNEEADTILPAINRAREEGIQCDGPFPADGWFGSGANKKCDAVLAMYHDQGLAPFKALSFGSGVNYTAGLPIIRTSPDHGTAFAIAGKDEANSDSMLEAIKLAIRLATTKKEKQSS